MSDTTLTGLTLQGVTKTFSSVKAVEGLTFNVPRGSMFGLLGANGAGKTTTLRMVLNILRPDTGSIYWNDTPVDRVPRPQFGYLPEERGLYPKMKTGEELIFLATLNDLSNVEARRRAVYWLDRLGLGDAWNRKVEELSKGNQQKVQVLAAILHDPDLMLLDEPFSGLDPINTEVLRDTLVERRAAGHTIIFSSHRLEQVEELCDRVAIIHHGRLLKTGLISDLKRTAGRSLVELAFSTVAGGDTLILQPLLSALSARRVIVLEQRADGVRLELPEDVPPAEIVRLALHYLPGPLKRFEVVEPSLEEIFLATVAAATPQSANVG